MADVTKINLEEIPGKVNEINAQIDAYALSYGNIYSAVETLKESYSDKDAAAFVTKIESFKNDFDNLKTLLGDYVAELNKIYADYTALQTDLASEANTLESGR